MRLTVTTTMLKKKHHIDDPDETMWLIVETGHDSMNDVYCDLADDGVINGVRVFTKRNKVIKRDDIILTSSGIKSIIECHVEYND